MRVSTLVRAPYFVVFNDLENCFSCLCLQYIPYRSGMQLLEDCDTGRETFLVRENRLTEMSEKTDKFGERNRQWENAMNQADAFQVHDQPPLIGVKEVEDVSNEAMSDEHFILVRRLEHIHVDSVS